ncbi:MAG: hypothetical protein A2052_10085 [Deltaproteobacteria bacterium GWA2_54_12]|nr:MAG: hypothetical protein A2052_10085 [Deltaproteobacteria bacterium GWA2_54_12]
MAEVSSELKQVFHTWAGLASHLIGACFDQAKPFLDEDFVDIDPYVRGVSAQLFIDCHLTSESVLLLIREAKEWDADLLNRSVMEGSIKYVYMLLGDTKEIRKKAEEYWETLPSFAAIKHSERAKRFLQDIPDPENSEWLPFRDLILEDNDVEAISRSYTRAQRRALKEKWSFSGISREFIQSGDSGLRFLSHLAHGYGMSSHLLHKDADGVGMVWERYRRDPHRQLAAKIGHSARVVSDVCTFAKLRLKYLLRLCNSSIEPIREIEKQYEFLSKELAKANSHFTKVEYGPTEIP